MSDYNLTESSNSDDLFSSEACERAYLELITHYRTKVVKILFRLALFAGLVYLILRDKIESQVPLTLHDIVDALGTASCLAILALILLFFIRFLGLIIGGAVGLFAFVFVLGKLDEFAKYINTYINSDEDMLFYVFVGISVLFLGYNLISLIISIKRSISP